MGDVAALRGANQLRASILSSGDQRPVASLDTSAEWLGAMIDLWQSNRKSQKGEADMLHPAVA